MPRFFAIIPAAGHSTRMGAPKLLLPVGNKHLMERTLAAWKSSGVNKIVVVVRSDDEALATLCRSYGVEVVAASVAPPEMKDSVQWGLNHIQDHFAPARDDAWLLAPADMPNLSPRIIDALIAAHQAQTPAILIPTLAGKRGHPILFPWILAAKVHELQPLEGINVLRQSHECRLVSCDDIEPSGATAFMDIDTPDEYDALEKP